MSLRENSLFFLAPLNGFIILAITQIKKKKKKDSLILQILKMRPPRPLSQALTANKWLL